MNITKEQELEAYKYAKERLRENGEGFICNLIADFIYKTKNWNLNERDEIFKNNFELFMSYMPDPNTLDWKVSYKGWFYFENEDGTEDIHKSTRARVRLLDKLIKEIEESSCVE